MNDGKLLEILFASIFFFLGSGVFHISFLISGHSIYRDLSEKHSTLVTVGAGIVLFTLTPIGFIVLFPEMFHDIAACEIPFACSTLPPELRNLIAGQTSLRQEALKVHGLLLEEKGISLWSFFLAALGMGLVVGCLSATKARLILLRAIRECLALTFPIYTYDNSWDHFFSRIKPGAKISVTMDKEGKLEGQLHSRSIKTEPRGVALKTTLHSGEQVLLTESSNIKEVRVLAKHLKRHEDPLDHATQAFYLAFAAGGFLLLAGGAELTSTFLGAHAYEALSRLYFYIFIGFMLSAVVTLLLAAWTSVEDFRHRGASLAFSPVAAVLIWLDVVAWIFLAGYTFWQAVSPQVKFAFGAAGFVAIFILVIFWQYWSQKNKILTRFFEKEIEHARKMRDNDCDNLLKILKGIQLEFDLSEDKKDPFKSVRDAMQDDVSFALTKREADYLRRFFDRFIVLVNKECWQGDEYFVARHLQRKLEKWRKRECFIESKERNQAA